MIKSMTAYGRGQAELGEGSVTVELRSVNSRFLDLHFRMPAQCAALEERIKKHVGLRLSRGRVNLGVIMRGAAETTPRLVLNKPLLAEYRRVMDELSQALGVQAELNPAALLNNRELVQMEEAEPDVEALWSGLLPALDAALDEAEAMRQAEGVELDRDFRARLARLDELFTQAAARSDEVVEAYRQRLNERLAKLLDNGEPDPQRVAMEVAIIADKCDVTEEAVRAQSHLKQFAEFLDASEPVGRKLDFLLQELNREANTVGSKVPDADGSTLVVEIKAELERLREQVQNIE